MAQWKRAGPITQRSMDRNHPLLCLFSHLSLSLSLSLPFRKEFHLIMRCQHHPLIAQLVERRTVVGTKMQISLGRWFESGSRDYFFTSKKSTKSAKKVIKQEGKMCPGRGSNSRPSDHSWIWIIMRLTRCRLRYRGGQMTYSPHCSSHKANLKKILVE